MPADLDAVRATFGEVEVVPLPGGPDLAAPAPTTVLGATTVAVLDDRGRAGTLVRLLDGPHQGIEVVVPADHLARVEVHDDRPPPLHRGTPHPAAEARAEALLGGLLTPSQRHQRAATGTFWVHNDHGWFRLGALYDLRVRSPRRPWVERSVCVVSEGYAHRPVADLWSELVVVLAADPTRVTAVANWNAEDRPRPPATDRAGVVRWLEQVRLEHRRRRRAGDALHTAYLAYDVAHRLRRTDRPGWAVPFAQRAAEDVEAWADRWPDERRALRAAHRPLLDLPDALGRTTRLAPDGDHGRST